MLLNIEEVLLLATSDETIGLDGVFFLTRVQPNVVQKLPDPIETQNRRRGESSSEVGDGSEGSRRYCW